MFNHDSIENEMENMYDEDEIVSDGQGRRIKTPRKKQWKCLYPGCKEGLKTKFNCVAHVWDCLFIITRITIEH